MSAALAKTKVDQPLFKAMSKGRLRQKKRTDPFNVGRPIRKQPFSIASTLPVLPHATLEIGRESVFDDDAGRVVWILLAERVHVAREILVGVPGQECGNLLLDASHAGTNGPKKYISCRGN